MGCTIRTVRARGTQVRGVVDHWTSDALVTVEPGRARDTHGLDRLVLKHTTQAIIISLYAGIQNGKEGSHLYQIQSLWCGLAFV